MANWKKVIVSGSQASLAGLSGSLLTDGKLLFGSGDEGAITSAADVTLNSDGHIEATFSGSASGSFEGDGSGLTGVIAQIENSLVDGNGIADFTFDGSAEVSVAVEPLSALSGQIQPVNVSSNGVGFDVDLLDGTGLTATDGVLNVAGLTVTEFADAAIVTESEGIASSDNDTSLPTVAAVKDYVDAQVGASDLDIVGDTGTDSIDLDSETLTFAGGNGIDTVVTAGSVSINGVAGLVSGSAQVVEHLPAGTVSGSEQVFADVSGDVVINSLGVATIQADSVALGTDTTGNYVATITGGTGITSDGATSGESIAHSLSVDYGTSAGSAVQGNVTLEVLGTTNEVEITNGDEAALGSDRSITIGLPNDVTIGNDLTVTGDLTVLGTRTELNVANLNVEDKFILVNSGSAGGDEDMGLIFGGTDGTINSGKAIYYDGGDDKFGFSAEISSDAVVGSLSSYIGAIEVSAAAPVDGTVGLQGVGTIHVNTSNEDIYIYV